MINFKLNEDPEEFCEENILPKELTIPNIMSEIPMGLRYCRECDGFTEHDQRHWYSEDCTICGCSKNSDMCDHCGFEFGDEHMEPPNREVILHGDGCHFGTTGATNKFGEWEETNDPYDETYADFIERRFLETYISKKDFCFHVRLDPEIRRCGCPVKIIYSIPIVFGYSEQSVFSMDCSNAIEWSYELRCPICGCLSQFSDGNC